SSPSLLPNTPGQAPAHAGEQPAQRGGGRPRWGSARTPRPGGIALRRPTLGLRPSGQPSMARRQQPLCPVLISSSERILGGTVGQQLAYPTAPRTVRHGFAFAVLECLTNAGRQKFLDDLSLGGSRHLRAGSAAPGVLHGKVERSRTGVVSLRRLSA